MMLRLGSCSLAIVLVTMFLSLGPICRYALNPEMLEMEHLEISGVTYGSASRALHAHALLRLGCPEQAITKLPKSWMPLLEYTMSKSKCHGD